MQMIDSTLDDGTPWRLVRPSNSEWCVLWLQGFTSTIERHTDGVVRMSKTTNTAHALLDYAGHGHHPIGLDDATRKQQLGEVLAVYDELSELGYTKIIVSGGSFGAYMATLLTKQRKPVGLILRAPAYYPDNEFNTPYKNTVSKKRRDDRQFHKDIINKKVKNHAINAIRSYNGPTYVMEHARDEVIHPSIPRTYFSVAKYGNYIIIPDVTHSPKTMLNPKPYYEMIEMWLATIIRTIQHIK